MFMNLIYDYIPRLIKTKINFQDIHTPRSNRSVDSGLPHDDITPRSDSLSTASSASPPDQHHHHHQLQQQQQHQQQTLTQKEIQQQHRKSNR